MLPVRVSPLVAPVMHPVHVRIHHWFVPHRLVWESWEDFITGGPDGLDASAFPTVDVGLGVPGNLGDYYGIPVGLPAGTRASALPHRGYHLIWNEWYRDQDLQAELSVPLSSGEDPLVSYVVQSCAWEKDYFTTCRPWVTKGGGVSLPIGISAPVVAQTEGTPLFTGPGGTPNLGGISAFGGSGSVNSEFAPGANTPMRLAPGWTTGLVADLQQASAVGINELREAFALQRYQEARARYGSRYTEYLAYLGVRSSDARLQRPDR